MMPVRKTGLSWQSAFAKPWKPSGQQTTTPVMLGGGPDPTPDPTDPQYSQGPAPRWDPTQPLPFGVANQATHLKEQAFGRRDLTLGELQAKQDEALLGYGYNASFDEAGNLSGLTVDPNNPFSKAALLKRNFDQSQQGATTSLAARGQLYSGALQNARNANTFGFQQGTNAQQTELSSLLKELIRRRLEAKTGAQNAVTNIDDNAIIQALGGAL